MRALLALTLVCVGAMCAAAQGDFVASDPVAYAEIAHRLASGGEAFTTRHPFEMRIGLTVPVALFYKLFGVSVFVSNLPCFLAALGIVIVAYAAAPTPRAKLFALVFSAASVTLVRHSAILLPDLPCGALMAASVLGLARRAGPNGARWLAGGMIAAVAAFLVKESAIWLAPIWTYAVIADGREHGARSTFERYRAALVVGAVSVIAYLVLCAIVWGSPLARLHGVDEVSAEHTWAMAGKSGAEWLARLAWQPPILFAKLFGFALVPAVIALVIVRGPARVWVVAAAVIALFFWFGSSSLTSYSPLPVRPRMVLPLLPCVLVLAAHGADGLCERITYAWGRRAVIVVLVGSVGFTAVRVLPKVVSPDRSERTAFAYLRGEAAASPEPLILVCGARRGTWLAHFYFSFALPPNVEVIAAADVPMRELPANARVRALVYPPITVDDPSDFEGDRARVINSLALPVLVFGPAVQLQDAASGEQLWSALHQAR